jgi:hypothetical protein
VREALRACAERSGVKVYDFANVGSHLHLLVRARRRQSFQAFCERSRESSPGGSRGQEGAFPFGAGPSGPVSRGHGSSRGAATIGLFAATSFAIRSRRPPARASAEPSSGVRGGAIGCLVLRRDRS